MSLPMGYFPLPAPTQLGLILTGAKHAEGGINKKPQVGRYVFIPKEVLIKHYFSYRKHHLVNAFFYKTIR